MVSICGDMPNRLESRQGITPDEACFTDGGRGRYPSFGSTADELIDSVRK